MLRPEETTVLGALTSPIRRRAAATVLALLAAGMVPLTALPARADVTVINCDDSGPGSLRQAVIDAGPGDTITFAAVVTTCTITLTSGEILIGKDLTIAGPAAGPVTISRDPMAAAFRIFNIAAGATVTISGVTITNGLSDQGGGILNAGHLTVTNSTLSDNTADFGGGIGNIGTLTVANSTLSHNAAAIDGAGIHNEGTATVTNSTLSGNNATCLSCSAAGAGINNASTGTVTVTNSTLSGNVATCSAGNGSCSAAGGGINNASTGTVTVTNSTLSGNVALCANGNGSCSAAGGGINNASTGTVTVTNSTLSGNGVDCIGSCSVAGGGIFASTGTVSLTATIVANSNGGNIVGTIISNGNFLAGNPLLAPLADNGGPTMTHALLPGSPAIDAVACGLPTDQRGVTRPQGTTCDIGAFELAAAAVITLTPPEATNPVGTTHTVTATVTVGGTQVTGWTVTFTITGGPNTGASGTCTINISCATGPAGTVSFTYLSNGTTGTDTITATVNNGFGVAITTDPVDKTWTALPGGGGGGTGGDDDDHDGGGSGRRGRITIVEDVRPDQAATFGFHTKELKAPMFRLADNHKRDFTNLSAGTYTVAQDKKDGWALDRLVCKDPSGGTKVDVGTRRATIKLKAGEHVVCTFTDKKK